MILAGRLLDPAEGRDVLVGAEQDPGLAGAGLRAQIGLPLVEAMGAALRPTLAICGRVAVAHRALEHRPRQPVDLEEDDARRVRRAVPPCRRAIRRMTRSEYVSSSLAPKITSSTSIAAAITSAASSAHPNESTLIVRVLMCEARSSISGVEHQHEHEAERERERQPQGGDDRRAARR